MERQHGLDRGAHPVGALPIRLVDDEDIGNLHDAGLERLHLVAGARHQHDDRHIGRPDDVDLVLPDAHRLDDDEIATGRVEDDRDLARRTRQAAELAARGHAADEDASVPGVRLHPHAVAENRAAGERARRIDRNHPDRPAFLTGMADELIDERALARARRSGDPHEVRPTGPGEQLADERAAGRGSVLDERDGPRERTRVPGEHTIDERVVHARSWRAMTSRWISLVPSPMVRSLTSRKYFSAG